MSEPEKVPDPQNKRKDLITRFKEDYAAALVEAKVSAEHTQTEGWRKLYAAQKHHEQETRRKLGQQLKSLATTCEDVGLTEDQEKFISDIKKASAELRAESDYFASQTVGPVKEPVLACSRVIENARRSARSDEANAPLVNVGLEELMRDAIEQVVKPAWDDEAGIVVT